MTTSPVLRHRLAGRLTVALAPEQAFSLFTPRGEQDWVAGWKPHFPAPASDDTAPGTIFETRADGRITTWVVVDRTPGRHIRYARVIPGHNAGTVTVTVDDAEGYSDVTVTYELTALTAAAAQQLNEFAADYPTFLHSWQNAIAASLCHAEEQEH
jgi:hypothetical protein